MLGNPACGAPRINLWCPNLEQPRCRSQTLWCPYTIRILARHQQIQRRFGSTTITPTHFPDGRVVPAPDLP